MWCSFYLSEPGLLERRHHPQGDDPTNASGQRQVLDGLGLRAGSEDQPLQVVRRRDWSLLRHRHHHSRLESSNTLLDHALKAFSY